MRLNCVSDVIEVSRMPGFPDNKGDRTNGNTLRAAHSLDSGMDPALTDFDIVAYSLHDGSPRYFPRELREGWGIGHEAKDQYKDYLNMERDIGANAIAEAFIGAMRKAKRRALLLVVRPPRGMIDCNRPSDQAVSLELGDDRLNEILLGIHARILEILFAVSEETRGSRAMSIDFHTMSPGSTGGGDSVSGQGLLRLEDLVEHKRMWNYAANFGKSRLPAILSQSASGERIGNYALAEAIKEAYGRANITMTWDKPYFTNPTFPGVQLIAGDGVQLEFPKNLVTKRQSGGVDLAKCKADIDKARGIVAPLAEAVKGVSGGRG